MKNFYFVIMTAFAVALTACGGDGGVAATAPGSTLPVSADPNAANLASSQQWILSEFQAVYGSITVRSAITLNGQPTSSVNIAGTTVTVGSVYQWTDIMAMVTNAATTYAVQCPIRTYNNSFLTSLSGLARTDFNCLRTYMNFNQLGGITVTYSGDPGFRGYSLAHSVDQLLNVLSQSYGQMINYWYGANFYPTNYNSWYTGTGTYIGVNYGSNGLYFNYTRH